MLPEHFIYDELKRQRSQGSEWQPEALELPLHYPDYEPKEEHSDEEETESGRAVIIIDMTEGYEIQM